MTTPLTEEELAEADTIKAYNEHRAYCDKLKDRRDGQYPSDWCSKMLATGKNDEIARRYGVMPGFRVVRFATIEEMLGILHDV